MISKRGVTIGVAAIFMLLASACSRQGSDIQAAPPTKTQPVSPAEAPAATGVVHATIKDMSITLDSTSEPAGNVTFVVRNEGPSLHEFVVLQTDTPAADFPIASFEGEKERFNEDAKGLTNVGEAGEVPPETTKSLSLNLKPGHYAVVCNLPGHYGAGMHQDFTVTSQ